MLLTDWLMFFFWWAMHLNYWWYSDKLQPKWNGDTLFFWLCKALHITWVGIAKRKRMNDLFLPRQRVIALMLDGLGSYHVYIHVWNMVSSATSAFLKLALMVLNNWCDRQQYVWQHFCLSKYMYKAESFSLYHETRLRWLSTYICVSTRVIKTFVVLGVEW